jgi:hypothetical protein
MIVIFLTKKIVIWKPSNGMVILGNPGEELVRLGMRGKGCCPLPRPSCHSSRRGLCVLLRPKINVIFYFKISCLTIRLIQIISTNITYFAITYSIIRDTLIRTYLSYYLYKKLNKTNDHKEM